MLGKKMPNHMSLICKLPMFMATFASQGVLNKHPSVWLNAAKPANTCIPPSFLGTRLTSPQYTHPKNMFQSTKNSSEYFQMVYLNDVQFGDNTIQQWRIAKCDRWGIMHRQRLQLLQLCKDIPTCVASKDTAIS